MTETTQWDNYVADPLTREKMQEIADYWRSDEFHERERRFWNDHMIHMNNASTLARQLHDAGRGDLAAFVLQSFNINGRVIVSPEIQGQIKQALKGE